MSLLRGKPVSLSRCELIEMRITKARAMQRDSCNPQSVDYYRGRIDELLEDWQRAHDDELLENVPLG